MVKKTNGTTSPMNTGALKRVFGVLVVLLLASVLMVTPVTAAESGTFTSGSTWQFDSTTGTFTLTGVGTGVMDDYSTASEQPWAAKSSEIKKLVIGSGITKLGNYAFSGASNLVEIQFEGTSTLEDIGKRSLEKTGLVSISIPDSVTRMGEQCLGECLSLTSVTIGSGLVNDGNWMFYGDESLNSITVSANNINFYSEDGVFFKQDSNNKYHTIILYPAAKTDTSYSIPEGTVHISSYAFQNCNGLKVLGVPSTLKTYGTDGAAEMFQLPNLEQITVATGNTDFTLDNSGAWVTTDGKKIILYPAKSSGTSYTIGENVEVIVQHAFSYATNLHEVYYNAKDASGTETWGSKSGTGARFLETGSNSGLKLVIGSTVEKIPAGMFKRSKITELIIEDGVTTIEKDAFKECTEIEVVTIPDTVKTIYGNAFNGCTGLKILTLGKGLTTFSGDNIFYNCHALETVYYNASNLQKTTSPTTNNVFANSGRDAPNGVTVYVGEDVTKFSGLWNCQYVQKLIILGSDSGCVLEGTLGSGELKELYISENVHAIPAEAFNHNDKLETIVFTGSDCGITSDLGGTESANVFVNSNGFSESQKQPLVIVLPKANTYVQGYHWTDSDEFHSVRMFILNEDSDAWSSETKTATKTGYEVTWCSDESLATPVMNTDSEGTYYAKWTLTPPISVTVATDKSSIAEGEVALLTATVDPVSATVGEYSYQWYKGSVADENKIDSATSSTYEVTTLGATSTFICEVKTIDKNTQKESTAVTDDVIITKAAAAGSVTINGQQTAVIYGTVSSFTFTYTADKTPTVASSNENVATAVSDNAGTVTVTIVGIGSTDITVSFEGDGVVSSASTGFTLTVSEAAGGSTVEVSGSSTSQGSSVWLMETQTPTPTPTVTPTESDTVPTDIPSTQPTETPSTPGFGILAVLAGLGAVAVLRRK